MNYLDLPLEWKEYYSKYPHGFSIWEAIVSWTDQVNVMVDHLNLTDKQVEELFTKTLPANVENVLNTWYASGQLANLINVDLLDMKANKTDIIKNPYIVIEGDSTAIGGTSGASMILWLKMMLKRTIIKNAVWGSWVGEVRARIQATIDLHPKYCILLMGTNNIRGGEVRTTTLADYEYILDILVKNSIEPIVCSVLPRGDFLGDNATIRIFNNCLLHMCQEKSIKFVDLYNPLSNEDGTPKAWILHNADNLHWSTYGGILGAREVIKAFPDIPIQNNANYPFNLFHGDYPMPENGVFTSDTNGDGLATHWNGIGAEGSTFTLEDNPKGGKYQVCTKYSTAKLSSGIQQQIGGITENATYRLIGELEFTMTDRTDSGQNDASVTVILEFLNSGDGVISNLVVDQIWYSSGMPLVDFYQDFTPPADAVSVKLTARANATAPFVFKVGGLHINVIK